MSSRQLVDLVGRGQRDATASGPINPVIASFNFIGCSLLALRGIYWHKAAVKRVQGNVRFRG